MEEMLPNLVLSGQVYAGKSYIAEVIAKKYNYQIINTGQFLLKNLIEKYGERDFTPLECETERELIVSEEGPLYFLKDNSNNLPLIIDGVRSLKVQQALFESNFLLVVLGASKTDRLSRLNREKDPNKWKINSEKELDYIDELQKTNFEVIGKNVDRFYINSNNTEQNLLATTIIEDSIKLLSQNQIRKFSI